MRPPSLSPLIENWNKNKAKSKKPPEGGFLLFAENIKVLKNPEN